MGQMKQWGFQLLEQLTDAYQQGRKLHEAVAKVADDLWYSGQFSDQAWLFDQVNTVAKHPEMFGQTPDYWQKLRYPNPKPIWKRLRPRRKD